MQSASTRDVDGASWTTLECTARVPSRAPCVHGVSNRGFVWYPLDTRSTSSADERGGAEARGRTMHPATAAVPLGGRRLTRLTSEHRRNIDARYRSPLHFLELWSITGALSRRRGFATTGRVGERGSERASERAPSSLLAAATAGIIYRRVSLRKTSHCALAKSSPFPRSHGDE